MNCKDFELKKNCVGNELIGIDVFIYGRRTFISYEIIRLLCSLKEHDVCFEEVLDKLFELRQKYI